MALREHVLHGAEATLVAMGGSWREVHGGGGAKAAMVKAATGMWPRSTRQVPSGGFMDICFFVFFLFFFYI